MTTRILLLALALTVTVPAALAQAPAPSGSSAPPAAQGKSPEPSPTAQEIIFSGKLYSPLKLSALLPYTCEVTSLPVGIGQKVKKDDVMLTFSIPLEMRMSEKRTLSLAVVKDLEHQLASTAKDIDKFRVKRKELEIMQKQDMATSQALVVNAQEIEVLEKQRQALQERLAVEREQAQQRLELAKERFGPKTTYGHLPNEGIVKAPMDGYILWINPELHKGVKLGQNTEVFQVGLVDPMLIRAQVHEIEALRLKVGDQAKVHFDSMPGKELSAVVNRIPWAPMPTALQQPSYYEIELSLPNADNSLKEGMKAQVTIIKK